MESSGIGFKATVWPLPAFPTTSVPQWRGVPARQVWLWRIGPTDVGVWAWSLGSWWWFWRWRWWWRFGRMSDVYRRLEWKRFSRFGRFGYPICYHFQSFPQCVDRPTAGFWTKTLSGSRETHSFVSIIAELVWALQPCANPIVDYLSESPERL